MRYLLRSISWRYAIINQCHQLGIGIGIGIGSSSSLYPRCISNQSPQPSARVAAIVEEIACLTLPEISVLTEVLRRDFWIKEVPLMVVVIPGTGYGGAKVVVQPRPRK